MAHSTSCVSVKLDLLSAFGVLKNSSYIFGNYKDLMADIDNWDFFSPYLLLIDEDFSGYIYINDNGDITESRL